MPGANSINEPIVALLLVGGAANGFVYRIIEAGKDQGSEAPLEVFGVSPLEILVIGVAAHLVWSAGPKIRLSMGLSVGIFAAAMLWPSSLLSWILVGGLAAIVAFSVRGPGRSGALLFVALAAWEIWSSVLEPMASYLLAIDAGGVAGLLSAFREDAVSAGNVVGAAGGHQIVVLMGCSTGHYVPLPMIAAIALFFVRKGPLGLAAIAGLAGLGLALVTINVVRLTLMAWSAELYSFVHGSSGALIFDALTCLLIVSVVLVIPAKKPTERL
jgi:hypothetical protein